MLAGTITIDGKEVGIIEVSLVDALDFVPDVEGYEPAGRAEAGMQGDSAPSREGGEGQTRKHGGGGAPKGSKSGSGGGTASHERPSRPRRERINRSDDHRNSAGYSQEFEEPKKPSGRSFDVEDNRGRPVAQGSEETDAAIRRAAAQAGIDPNTMRSIASIESAMNPNSNANRSTQYKGLYQIGRNEWARFGQGNIYSAEDNAMATARMFRENSKQFSKRFGRDPTDTELYLMHQQGLGFYTRGAMTNIQGNPYPGMRGPQTSESFEAGWGREVARRKAAFARKNNPPQTATAKPPEDL
jgi:hypothetical protein